MLLYLVQHAEARSEEDDPRRDLTEKGRMDIEAVSHHLKRLKVEVKQILHSGKTRAHTTANILGEHLQPSAGVSEAPGLAPMDDPGIWADLLMSGNKERSVINFQMGGAVQLQHMEADQWALDWMIVPNIIL